MHIIIGRLDERVWSFNDNAAWFLRCATDRERARWTAVRRVLQLEEQGIDTRRARFVGWLVWRGTLTEELRP